MPSTFATAWAAACANARGEPVIDQNAVRDQKLVARLAPLVEDRIGMDLTSHTLIDNLPMALLRELLLTVHEAGYGAGVRDGAQMAGRGSRDQA